MGWRSWPTAAFVVAPTVEPVPGLAHPCLLAGASEAVLGAFGDPSGLLSPAELDRARRFRFVRDRDDFLAAHVLGRACVAVRVGAALGSMVVEQRCDDCGGAHGRPRVVGRPDVHVSWSHAHGYVAAGAADVPIGVDVEVRGHGGSVEALADVALSAADAAVLRTAADPERFLLQQWTRKECLVKLGLTDLDTVRRLDLAGLPVEPDGLSGAWRAWRSGLQVLDWTAADGTAVGAAMVGDPRTSIGSSAGRAAP